MTTSPRFSFATRIAGLIACSAWATTSSAQVPATAPAAQPAAAAVAPQGPVIALVAAIGDRLQYVRQRRQVGSNIEPYTRATLAVPDQALNWAVLRGLDRAVERQDPTSKRVLLNFQPSEAEYKRILAARNDQRGSVTSNVLVPYLTAMPERKQWDQIITVTPAYRFSEVNGMGSKFAGVGVYVQPLERQEVGLDGVSGAINVGATAPDGDDVTFGPGKGNERTRSRSSTYVAPYFYFEITTYDAKTMKVLKREQRLDYIKLYDPKSTALDVGAQFTPEQLSEQVERLVETSAVRAILGEGRVDRGDVKPVPKQN